MTVVRRLGVLAAALSLLLPTSAAADAVPVLRLIAPAAPGGGWDQTARAMQAVLQQTGLVGTSSVENIPGAAGTIGLARVIGAERGNGDVLMLSGLIMVGAVVTHRSPVTLQQVTPIARLLGEYEVVVVPAASPIRTLEEFVATFRANPEAVSWGGGSAGGTDQILAGLFADAVGVDPRRVNYIAYSGGGESLAAILGGQVTAGVNGLAELAPHIATGAVRALAISSAERLPGVEIPTFREQQVPVEIENWRSVVAPPGISGVERQRLEALMAAMVQSAPWRDMLTRYRWNDRYLTGTAFARFSTAEEARVQDILGRLGTGEADPAVTREGPGRYPWFVFGGLLLTALVSLRGLVREGATRAALGPRPEWRALLLVGAAVAVEMLLFERAGFVLASAVLCWLTARAFDRTHPLRDAVVAGGLSVAAWVLFVRLLQQPLPPGLLAGWL